MIDISFNNNVVSIYYDGSLTEEEKEKLLKEKERLINSIKRRETLLSNPGYVNKAPENIVNKEKEDLQKEKNELELINLKLI